MSADRKTDLVVAAAVEYVMASDAIPDNIFEISETERTSHIQRHIVATYALKVAVNVYLGLDTPEDNDYIEIPIEGEQYE